MCRVALVWLGRPAAAAPLPAVEAAARPGVPPAGGFEWWLVNNAAAAGAHRGLLVHMACWYAVCNILATTYFRVPLLRSPVCPSQMRIPAYELLLGIHTHSPIMLPGRGGGTTCHNGESSVRDAAAIEY